jgi:hypothetical protein
MNSDLSRMARQTTPRRGRPPLYVGEKSGRNWSVRTAPKPNVYMSTNPQFSIIMAPTKVRKARKSRARYYTPPPDLISYEGQAKTPQRAGVLYAKLFSQALNVPIPTSVVIELIHSIL